VPPQPDASKFPSVKQYNGGEPYFDAITDAHVDLLAQALACGITRFATLFMNDLSYANNPLGLPTDNHGSVAHTYDASPVGNNGRPGAGNPATWVPLAKFNRYSYSKIARFMQRLDEFGVLDSTLIYASSDMGNPSLHSTRNVPTLLAGGANGKLRMGRRIKLKADCPPDAPWCGEADATFTPVTNSRVLVSIAQAFGVEIESFGSQRFSVGPRLIQLSLSALGSNNPWSPVREALRELVDDLGETCNIGVLEGFDYVYIDRIESKWPLRFHLEVGHRAAVNCIAGGKVLLAYLEPELRGRLLRSCKLAARTPRSITSVTELEAELDKVRARGYGTNNEENFEGIVAIAVPILDARQRVVAALTMHGPMPRVTMQSCEAALPRLREGADRIAAAWGLI
jgi:DNA-binding IclR family transcriptional regulator